KEENGDFILMSCQLILTCYSEGVSTCYVLSHLSAKHEITDKKQTLKTKKHITTFFNPASCRTSTSSKQDRKEQLRKSLTLMCCTSLLPFSIVENEGFQDFLVSSRVASSRADISTRTTLCPNNVNKSFNVYYEKLLKQLKLAPTYPKDVEQFLRSIKNLTKSDTEITDAQRLEIVRGKLTQTAGKWFDDNDFQTWLEFETAFRNRYSSSTQSQLRFDQLLQRKQEPSESVAMYFDDIVSLCKELDSS
ncbi:unnamed protein product, partial [Didymodactylos carnosus]